MGKQKKKEKHRLKAKKDREPKFDISQETRNSILGVASFIVAVLSVFSFVNMAGRAGEIFNVTAKSLFGWGFFLVPLAFVLLGISFVKSIERKIYSSAIFGTALFILSFLGVFFIFGSNSLTFSQRIVQGGYFGVILGFPFLKLTGFSASLVIFIAAMFISLLLSLNIPIRRLLSKEEKEKPLVDNIVVKKGDQVVDPEAEKNRKPESKAMLAAKAAKTEPTDKEFMIKHIKAGKWVLPPIELLHSDQDQPTTGDINASANIIKRTLGNFGIDVEMGEVSIGPTVTRYTLRPAVGVKLSKITALNPDLSLALAAHPIRIEAPIPGKALVGIEVPNRKVAVVGLRNMIESEDYQKSKYFLPLAMGRDVAGVAIFAGLEKMPHLLVAGATGSGKSVSINTILMSLLYKHSPEVLKLILVDPKRVELTLYNGIPHLITPVITEGKKVLGALRWAVGQMELRFDALSKVGARDIFSYNAKMTAEKEDIMPFMVIVIDELADLMASYGRDVESAIVRLAQMSRAVGIHLIVSTQRPSVEVITGTIKANITSRMAFQVASNVDSRTILDMSGAEKLLGNGDMLYLAGDSGKPRRLQGSLISEKEVKDVVKFIKMQAEELGINEEEEGSLQVDFNAPAAVSLGGGAEDDAGDDMYEEAKAVVVSEGKASTTLLQRRLKLGYARAARVMDLLEEKGVIGPGDGAKPREVYIRPDGTIAQEPAHLVGLTGINADTPEAEKEEV